MLTQSTDYDFMTPSADEISGDIIPVADIAGRTPTIRREDAYHLLETEWDFLHKTTTPPIGVLTGVEMYARFYNLFNDLSSFRDVQRLFTPYTLSNLRFTNLLQAVSNVYNTNTTADSEFFDWIAQNYPSYILACPQLPSTNPFPLRKPFDADILRMMYWLMDQPSYEVFREMANTYNPTLYRYSVVAGNTYDVRDISYNSHDGGLVETTKTFHIVGNGCVEGRENPTSGSYYTSFGGVVSLRKKENGSYQYMRKNTLPQSDIFAEIEFDSALNISAAFIVYTLYCWYGNSYCKKKFWLEPLTHTTGSKWKFKIYDVAKARALVDLVGVPWEGDSSWGSQGTSCSLSYSAGYEILAMVEGKKYKLPAGWNWSPN